MTAPPEREASLSIPLRSDPTWLTAGVLAVTLACAVVFAALFKRAGLVAGLGVIPGLTFGVFLGSALAAWARRRGGTLTLRLTSRRVELCGPEERQEWLDLAAPYAAVLLVDPKARRRLLVVGQHGDPLAVLETDVLAPDGDPLKGLDEAWRSRALVLDLESFAVSPASSNTVALAVGQRIEPLLERLAPGLHHSTPWLIQPTASGDLLKIWQDEVRFGAQVVPLDEQVKAVPYAVKVQGAQVAGLGLSVGEGALLLMGCEEAPVEREAVTGNLTPDAYVPLPAFELLRAVVRSKGDRAHG